MKGIGGMVDKEAFNSTITEMADADDSAAPRGWTESAFEAIFTQHYARLVAVLFRLVGDRARAEELADDVLWKLYRKALPREMIPHLQGWLYKTATRLGLDALRARARRARYEHAAVTDAGPADPAAASPLGDVLRSEQCEQVRRILSQLKPAQAEMLILRSSGLSYKEIGQALGVKETSVGTLLNRAEAEFEKLYRKFHKD